MTLSLTKEDFDELAGGHPSTFDYDVFKCSHLEHSRFNRTRWMPAFALNDLQLQAVLMQAAIKYSFRNKLVPQDLTPSIDSVIQLAKQRHEADLAHVENSAKLIQNRIYRHLLCVEEAGGYVACISAVAFRCWRLKWPAVFVARDLGLSKRFVYEVKQMLVAYAEELGFPTYLRAPAKGRVPASKGTFKVDRDAILAHRKAGLGIMEISRRVGCSSEAVSRALKISGMYYSRQHDAATIEKIAALRKHNLKSAEIAAQLNLTVVVVRNILKRLGIPCPKGWEVGKSRRDERHTSKEA